MRRKNPFGILLAYPYPGIKIAGVPWQSVNGNRVSTDDEKSDVVSNERFDKRSEVRIEMHLLPQSFVGGEPREQRDAPLSMSLANRESHQARFQDEPFSRRGPWSHWFASL